MHARRVAARSVPAVALIVLSGFAGRAVAQCDPVWATGEGVNGVMGSVYAMTTWDPDGTGPATPLLVFGGNLGLAGDAFVKGFATWDPATGAWGTLGGPFSFQVNDLIVDGAGALIAVGDFATVGGVTTNGIARWDGTAWQPMGLGVNHYVAAIVKLANGDLVIGGDFTTVDGVQANHVARWDGTQWWPLGAGFDTTVTSLTTLPNGDLVVGGYFSNAGGAPASRVARWDGAAWSPLGSGLQGGSGVQALATLANGDVVAGGQFTQAGGGAVVNVARWDGVDWSPLDAGANGTVQSLYALPGGDLLMGGNFTTAGGVASRGIARWDGSSWSSLDGGLNLGAVYAMHAFANDDFVVGGFFSQAGAVGADNLARRTGGSWSPLATGVGGAIKDFATLPDGSVLAVGAFRSIDGQRTGGLARFDGSQWHAVEGNFGGSGVGALTVAQLPGGQIVVGGLFSSVAGVGALNIASWDGSNWSPLGSGLGGYVRDLAVMPNGDLIAVGDMLMAGAVVVKGVARWDGVAWSALGNGVAQVGGESVSRVLVLDDGSILVGGSFAFPGSTNLARWDGSSWQPYGGGTNGVVTALQQRSNGEVAVGGTFTHVGLGMPAGAQARNYIARFDGQAWVPQTSFVTGAVTDLANLPGGDLLVVGNFFGAGMVAVDRIARFDGSSWRSFGGGLTDYFAGIVDVKAAGVMGDGTVVVGGQFQRAGGNLSVHFARLLPSCPATVASFGPGCPGGAVTLTVSTLPWLGDKFRAEANGLPANGLAVSVYGFATTAVPLSSLLPQGRTGCLLLTQADAVTLAVPTAGRVTTSLPVPNASALVGAIVHHQVLPIELDTLGAIVDVTASNRLTLQVGDF